MNVILLALSLSSIFISIRKFGLRSFVFLGVMGSVIYAIPAILNMTPPQQYIPTGELRYFIEPSKVTIFVYCLYFLFLCINMHFFKKTNNFGTTRYLQNSILLSLYICLFSWYFLSVINDGFLFFLKGRFEISQSIFELVLKWSIPISIYYGLLTKNPIKYIGSIFLVFQFLSGDRTLLAITLAGVIFLFLRYDRSIKHYMKLRYIILASFAFCIVLFGKPIYLIVKTGTVDYALQFMNLDTLKFFIVTFEPFSIFNHFDFAVREGLVMHPYDFLRSILGNLFVNPGSIDITVNQTNLYLMNAYPNFITNGIGGSYLANAWMVLRVPGLYLFSLLFIYSLSICDTLSKRSNSFLSSIAILFGAIIAVYSHRNGLGNLLAFFRQIVISSGLIFSISIFIQLLYKK